MLPRELQTVQSSSSHQASAPPAHPSRKLKQTMRHHLHLHGRVYPTGRASIRHSFSRLNRQLAQTPQHIAKPKASAPPTHKRTSRLIHVYDTLRDVLMMASRVHKLFHRESVYKKNNFTSEFPIVFLSFFFRQFTSYFCLNMNIFISFHSAKA